MKFEFVIASLLFFSVSLLSISPLSSSRLYANDTTYTEVDIPWQVQEFLPEVPSHFFYSGDLNGDGNQDVILAGSTPLDVDPRGGEVGLILFNNGDNTFRKATGDLPVTEWVGGIIIADFNGDDIPDLFMADHGYDAPPFPGFPNTLLLGSGEGYVDVSSRLPSLKDFTHSASSGDIDGDGDLDVAVLNLNEEPDKLSYFLINDGQANFTMNRARLPASLTKTVFSELNMTSKGELVDLNKDGFVDLVVGEAPNVQASFNLPSRVYWNDGLGYFSDENFTPLPKMLNFPVAGYEIKEIEALDFDRDGNVDLMLSANSEAFTGTGLQLIRNLGDGNFTDASQQCLDGVYQSASDELRPVSYLAFADVNNDGIIDILTNDNRNRGDDTIILFEGSQGGKYRAITAGDMGLSSQTRDSLTYGGLPITSTNGFGIFNFFNFEGKTQFQNHPIEVTAGHRVANSFDACTGVLVTNLDAGEFGSIGLNFRILQSTPEVLVQPIVETLMDLKKMELQTLPTRMGTLDMQVGELFLPELVIDGEVFATGLEFQLIDPQLFIIRLESSL